MLNADTNIESIIHAELIKISALAGKKLEAIAPTDTIVTDLQFTSLMLARLIIELEIQTGFDPFSNGASVVDTRTVADLVSVYSNEQVVQS